MKIKLDDLDSYRKIFNIDDSIEIFCLNYPCYGLNVPIFEQHGANFNYRRPFLLIQGYFAALHIYENGFVDKNGFDVYELWSNVNYYHNDNGPAFVQFNSKGNITKIMYYVNNQVHNAHGPACICYNEFEQKKYEVYRINGKLHNSIGPAYIWRDENIWRAEYAINDAYINKSVFFERLQNRNLEKDG